MDHVTLHRNSYEQIQTCQRSNPEIELPSPFSQLHVFLNSLNCSNGNLLLHKSQAIKDFEATTVIGFEKITPELLWYDSVAQNIRQKSRHVHWPGSISEVKKSEFDLKYYPPGEYRATKDKHGASFTKELQAWIRANCNEFDKQWNALLSKLQKKKGGGDNCKRKWMDLLTKYQQAWANKLLKTADKYKELSSKENDYSSEEKAQVYKVFQEIMGDSSSSREEQKEKSIEFLWKIDKVVKKRK